jgi:hypothetical protein
MARSYVLSQTVPYPVIVGLDVDQARKAGWWKKLLQSDGHKSKKARPSFCEQKEAKKL